MGSRNGIEKVAAAKAGVPVDVWMAHRAAGQLWCYACRTWRDTELFGLDKSRSNGRASACKPCVSQKATACRYGVTFEHARSLRSGTRVCEICGRQRKLEVDHNHETGSVRGILCARCNRGLGQFLDSAELLLKALAYLEKKRG